MSIAAAAPDIPWTDLVYSLLPNGRTLDYTITPDDPNGATKSQPSDLNPVGVMKESFVSGLYATGQQSGFIAPPGVDSGADLTPWYTRTQAGEPPDSAVDWVRREYNPAAVETVAQEHWVRWFADRVSDG